MKEFSKTMDLESLAKGLRRDFRSPRNTYSLLSCMNCKPSPWGLVPYDPVIVPFDQAVLNAYGIELKWPYPQLIRGNSVTILATDGAAFWVDESDWSLTQIEIRSIAAPGGGTITLTSGGSPWQFADCYDTWYMVNGAATIFRAPYLQIVSPALAAASVLGFTSSPIPSAQACAYYKGRLIFGGFDPSKSWSSSFVTDVQAAANKAGLSIDNTLNNLGRNSILWSSVGGGDIPLFWWLYGNYAKDGMLSPEGYGTGVGERSFLLDMMQRNEWGFMPLPFRYLHSLKNLGEYLIAYGDTGVIAIQHNREYNTLVPVAIPVLKNIGISYPGAVGGSVDQHKFIDNSGALWHLGLDLKPERIGYKEYFQQLVNSNIMVSYSQDENEFWFCNNYRTFHLTSAGLCEVDQVVTSVVDSQGLRLGLGQNWEDANRQAVVVWDTMDFGNRGRKTLEWMQLPSDVGAFESLEFSVYWRNNRWEQFRQSPWKIINSNGAVRVGVTAVDFRPALRFTNLQSANIQYMTFSYKQTDKRYIRGAYATAADV